jgi:hypothetical protein
MIKNNKLKKIFFLSLFSSKILFAQTIQILMDDPTNKTKWTYSSQTTSTWGGTSTTSNGPLLSAFISERIMGPVTESTGKGPVLNINQLVVLTLNPNTISTTIPKYVPMVINVISSGVMNANTSSCLTKIKSLPFLISPSATATTKPTPSIPSEVKPGQPRLVRLDDAAIGARTPSPDTAPFILNAGISSPIRSLSDLTRNPGDDFGTYIQSLSYQNLTNCPAFN